ncbi:lipopolysaccharide biosynthesis protein [Arthrobacter sp. ZBG10]|uniref:lipopolysaccharide biosynthesis protein n=1 Tax=Arthrobacter sp. ZBG10 TaxID=1676590 RepID=UPI0009E33DE0|nr:lipopolysaccharide biosynthesis protein [Arthrobacter sp. ZBG10]
MLRQFSWIAFGRLFSAVLQFLTFVLLANKVSPAEFGMVAAVVGAAIVPQSFLDFGISTYIISARAAGGQDARVAFALQLNNRISLVFAFLALIALFLMGIIIDPIFIALCPLAFWAAGEKNADTWLGVAIADGDAHLNLIGLMGRRVLSLLLLLVGFALSFDAPVVYSCAMAIAAFGAACFAQLVVRRRLPTASGGSIRETLSLSRPYWLHSFATQLRNVDAAVVALVGSPAQAGYYSVASRISGPLRLVPTSLASVLLPGVAKEGKISVRTTKLIILTLAGMAVMYGLIVATAPLLIPSLMGAAYTHSVMPVQAMCVGLIFGAAASMFAAILQGLGEQKFVARSSMASSLACIPAIILGTIWLGATGASIGFVSSFLLQTFLFSIKLFQRRQRRKHGRHRG